MATTLNMVTVGNDFVLRVKVGMVQYSNNSVQWDYMDLTTCRNIVFNISCTKHDIDINLPYTIDQTDHAVISATVRAEMLHENSIYNFSITGIDSEGYRWTYISPKQQSFVTTSVSQDSANAYTELAFTAGMIMPLAAQGKNGFTPYIGQNNHWWINGEDTGVSAVGDIDLTDYATKEYVDDAIENIDIQTDLTNYYTKSETDEAISYAISNIPADSTPDLSNYVTTSYLNSNYYDKTQTDQQISDISTEVSGKVFDKTDIINQMLNANGDTSQFQNIYFIDFMCATQNGGYYKTILLYNGSIVDAVKIGEEETPFNTGNHVDIIRLRFYHKEDKCFKEIIYGMDMYDHGNPFNYYMTKLEVSDFDYSKKEDILYGNYVDGNYVNLDTGVPLSDTLRFVVEYQRYDGCSDTASNHPTISAFSNDNMYFVFGGDNETIQVYYPDIMDCRPENSGFLNNSGYDYNKHIIEWSLSDGVYFDNEQINEGTQDSVISRVTNNGDEIPNIVLYRNETNHIALYNVKIYDGDTLLRDYEPVTTNNGNGYHDKVNDTYLLSNDLSYHDFYRFLEIQQYKEFYDDVNNRINNINIWGPVNEIYSYYDCTEAIDKILNNDTITTGIDIQSLWECAFNHDLRKAQPVYKNSPVSWYIDRDENNQTLKTYYRFWNRDDGLYYNVTVQWYYYTDDVHECLDNNILSTSYSTTEYATKGYVDNAISNIPSSTPDLSSYVTTSYLNSNYYDKTETDDAISYAISNIPSSTPDLSSYVTTSYLNSNYYDKQTSDNNLDTLFDDVLESPIYNNPAQFIPHSTIKFLGTTNRIKIYDIFKWELPGQAIRSSNGFKIGILSNETDFAYANLSNLTYDNHVNINIWWKEVQTRAITQTYEYFDTTFNLTTADNNISFNLVEEGDDMLGHYIIVDIEGAYFGAVEAVSDITTYTGSEDTTDITINQGSGLASMIYDPATTKYTVFSKYYQNNANATILTAYAFNKHYALKSDIPQVPSIQTMTQAQYDQMIADGLEDQDTIYIIL